MTVITVQSSLHRVYFAYTIPTPSTSIHMSPTIISLAKCPCIVHEQAHTCWKNPVYKIQLPQLIDPCPTQKF